MIQKTNEAGRFVYEKNTRKGYDMPSRADAELLEKLLLGQLPAEEVTQLAAECADDKRRAELAASLPPHKDELLKSLRNGNAPIHPQTDALISRLLDAARSDTIGQIAEERPDSAPLPESLDHFKIRSVLGQGGMGIVYLAEDTRLGRVVALKTLKRDLAVKSMARDRFLREARTTARLTHDHIVPIYHVGEADGTPYLAMPYLQGEALDQRIAREHRLAAADAIRIARQIAIGLAAAHAHGLIHRDIKPANIWLEAPTGRVKILDFGLARAQQEATHLTASGAIMGTPAYMAPEQGRGKAVDHRADLFSLGSVLYEMLTGSRAFVGPDVMSVLTSLAIDTPKFPHEANPHCPLALSRLTMQLLAKDPDQRPKSAQDVVDALDKINAPPNDATIILDEPSGDKQRPPETDPFVPPVNAPRRRRIPFLIAVALALLLLWLGAMVLTQFRKVPTSSEPVIAQTTPQQTNPVIDKEAHRKAAEYVLAHGGTLRVDGQEQDIKQREELPTGTFQLTRVGFSNNKEVTDEGLAVFKDCTTLSDLLLERLEISDSALAHFSGCVSLKGLLLSDLKITDAGLAHFKDRRLLEYLSLSRTHVSDVGMAYFRNCDHLQYLDLAYTDVTDVGLAHFKNCKGLKHLVLGRVQAGNVGLANFNDCPNLVSLIVNGTKVTDAGLQPFAVCKGLAILNLADTDVGDSGMVNFKQCLNLIDVSLAGTKITDASLDHFKNCKQLKKLVLLRTAVTLNKIDELQKALPDCKIEWDQVDRRAAVAVLSLKGKITIDDGQEREILDIKDLPNRSWILRQIDLSGKKTLTHAALKELVGLKNLKALNLQGTPIINTWLKELAGLESLESLSFDSTSISDAGLKELTGLKNLVHLSLHYCQVRGQGLGHLAELAKLRELDLGGVPVTTENLKGLAGCKSLQTLILNGTEVKEGGFSALSGIKSLRHLELGDTKITEFGVKELVALTQIEELTLNGTGVKAAALSALVNLKNLRALDLHNNVFTDAEVTELAKMKMLRFLDLENTKLTEQQIEALKKALPDCKIEK